MTPDTMTPDTDDAARDASTATPDTATPPAPSTTITPVLESSCEVSDRVGSAPAGSAYVVVGCVEGIGSSAALLAEIPSKARSR